MLVSLGVLSFEGREGFGGPDDVYENVFIPVLTTHLILVVLGLIFAFYMLSQGFRASKRVDGEYLLKEGEPKDKPQKIQNHNADDLWVLGYCSGFTISNPGKSYGSEYSLCPDFRNGGSCGQSGKVD